MQPPYWMVVRMLFLLEEDLAAKRALLFSNYLVGLPNEHASSEVLDLASPGQALELGEAPQREVTCMQVPRRCPNGSYVMVFLTFDGLPCQALALALKRIQGRENLGGCEILFELAG